MKTKSRKISRNKHILPKEFEKNLKTFRLYCIIQKSLQGSIPNNNYISIYFSIMATFVNKAKTWI